MRYYDRMIKILLEGAGVLVLAVVVTLGIYAAEKTGLGGTTESETGASAQSEVVFTATVLADSDNDGLQDWEEALWRTDPADPDTDKDGTADGEETRHNRNPLRAGPNDELFATTRARETPSGIPTLPAKVIPALVATMEPPKSEVSVQSPEIRPTVAPAATPESPEKAALRKYGNEVARILRETVQPSVEIAAFESYLKENKADQLASLGKSYGRRVQLLQQVSAPEAAASLHSVFTKATGEQSASIEHLATFERVGEVPLQEWTLYKERVIAAGKAVYDLALLFKTQGVFFKTNEAGSLFTLFH